ncbi:PREDICTED: uncharacterized protein LOC105456957 [Wasmannia auropunctata]|uniref:uncharacterized protein LOC105456957 n=1 Tax=Wasmannia auropunctata TaxID=64793 RepID=UPI0005EDF20C|nr:PREDICTED: uncharacterized protein LOC105456957 [Wasmannia auropunctata]
MNLSIGTSVLCVLLVALLSETVYAKPAASPWYNMQRPRYKRQSDQRMAELETLLALEKVKGIVVPIGFGVVDPKVVGRKRRAIISEEKLQNLLKMLLENADQSLWEDPQKE